MANVDEKVSKMTAIKKIRIYHKFLKSNSALISIFVEVFPYQTRIGFKYIPISD